MRLVLPIVATILLALFMVGVLSVAANGGQPPSPAVQMALGGAGSAAVAPPGGTLTPMEITGAVLATVAALIGYHFTFSKYIRQQAGVKESTSTTLDGQPIKIEGVMRFVERDELNQRLIGYVTRDDLHDAEKHLDEKLETNFRALDEKRSKSIGNVHEHLRGMSEKLIEKIDASAQASREITATSARERREESADLHEKVNAVAEAVAEMRGEIRRKGRA